MPWGVEIYGLLTRWNPLNVRRPYALPYNGKNVLVVGLGPAGYTLAHYLLNEGFGVVAHRRPEDRAAAGGHHRQRHRRRRGRSATGARSTAQLDERVLEGFGGVSEYGITVRWDKNFLTLLHLTLARRDQAADLRRRPLRRHAADRRRVGLRVRSRRDRRRRRPADDHRHEEQPDPRHPQGQRLPDGAAADRRVQARRAAEPAGAAAGGGHRRRPDRRSTPRPS